MSEINNEYLKIATMTNKEAAEIIKNMICHANIGRGNGKTLLMLRYNTALHKAIQCLEKYPDEEAAKEELDFREFMEHLEKETEGTFHPGLREDTFGSLQVLGWDEFPSTINDLPSKVFDRTNVLSPNDFSQFMNPPVIGIDLAPGIDGPRITQSTKLTCDDFDQFVNVNDVLERARVSFSDDVTTGIRTVISENPEAPLTDEEKAMIQRTWTNQKLPLTVEFK